VFERSRDGWSSTRLVAPDGDTNDRFGRAVALSDDGTTTVIGAELDNHSEVEDAGAAYVFRRTSGQWEFQTKLVPGDSSEESLYFGHSTALSADGPIALVGARRSTERKAYVFRDF
jgi:hypothetical protein